MAEAVSTTVGAAAVSGVISFPVLAAFGIDPVYMASGLMGCIVVQTLVPSDKTGFRAVVLLTIGSVLFACLVTPLVAPWALSKVSEWALRVPNEAVKSLTAATLAAFAQPIVLWVRSSVPNLLDRLSAFWASKRGSGDA